MNTSSFFLAGILLLGLPVSGPSLPVSGAGLLGPGALPQATNNQATPAKQSSITFVGTVSQVAATSLAAVPKSPQTIVVRVDSVLKKPAAVSLKKGDTVTVEVKDPAAFQEGTQATFYTEGWIFGSGVAVKELGHDAAPSGGAPGARTSASASHCGLCGHRAHHGCTPMGDPQVRCPSLSHVRAQRELARSRAASSVRP